MKEATKASAGWATSCAAVPSWRRRPSTSTPIRPASAAASRKSWVTTSVGSARAPSTSCSSPRTTARVCASSADSGSSSSRTCGSRASARATATRWRSPPDSAPGRSSARCPMRRRSSSAPTSASAAPAEGDVAAHGHVREQRVLLEDEAHRTPLGRQVDLRAASNHARSPRAMRPRSGRRSPAMARRTVDLPAPEGPTSATVSAPMLRRRPSSNERRATAKSSSSVSTRRGSCRRAALRR